jgi:hypothetical protein
MLPPSETWVCNTLPYDFFKNPTRWGRGSHDNNKGKSQKVFSYLFTILDWNAMGGKNLRAEFPLTVMNSVTAHLTEHAYSSTNDNLIPLNEIKHALTRSAGVELCGRGRHIHLHNRILLTGKTDDVRNLLNPAPLIPQSRNLLSGV